MNLEYLLLALKASLESNFMPMQQYPSVRLMVRVLDIDT